LSYPRSPQAKSKRYITEFCEPLLAGLARRPAAERRAPASRSPEEALALLEELDLDWAPGPQQRRLACLQLGAAGFSVRQIAAQTGISKSSVARLLLAGVDAIDQRELLAERLRRYYPGTADQQLAALGERPPAAEIRLLLPADR
jgi:hypothetical protein